MNHFFESKGIIHQTTCIEIPEQNGIVEQKHQHLLNVTRALLFHSNLPPSFWNFAIMHVVHLINCIPTPFLQNVSPFQKLYDKPCDISTLRVFGCLCYINTLQAHRKKLDPRANPCIYLGFKPNTKGYLIFNLHTRNIEVSRNVVFYEDHFPYTNSDQNTTSFTHSFPSPTTTNYFLHESTPTLDTPVINSSPSSHSPAFSSDIVTSPPVLRRSTRMRQAPTYLHDFHVNLASTAPTSSPDILSDTSMLACSPSSTPMDYFVRLSASSGEPLVDPSAYRRLVGRLVYLTHTRPDITHVVQHLSQFVVKPTSAHHQAVIRVLCYLKHAPGYGIFLAVDSPLQLKAFSDSNWAGCVDSRRFITGFCIYLGNSLISWRSKKQPTVSRSSSEVEYRALASTSCELQWLIYLLDDHCIQFTRPTLFFCDN
uniref:Integrase catalytic domain-containing protein n=1 Tax=Cajanus cajan TaxID=3821 RepID=A0A151TNS4_CAJCA|nr:hypothetical protein KK1_022356 [Cajanus cajan]